MCVIKTYKIACKKVSINVLYNSLIKTASLHIRIGIIYKNKKSHIN